MEPAQTPVSRLNAANIVTVARIALIPVFAGLLFAAGWQPIVSLPLRWAALGVFVAAAATDRLDGYLARSRGLITDLGKLLDPIADKALIGTAVVLVWFPLREFGPYHVGWWVPAVILVRELGITIMRMGLKKYAVMPAGRGGKLKTFLQTVALGGFLMPLETLPGWVAVAAWVVLLVAMAVTVATGVDYAIKGYKIRSEGREYSQPSHS